MVDLVLQALKKARSQIARPGYFHKHQYYAGKDDKLDLDRPCCIYGAIGFAVNVHPRRFTPGSLGKLTASALYSFVPEHITLFEYSDHKTTTQNDMVALFTRAIEARKA